MSDELATDEADAEDFEIGSLTRSRLHAEEGRDGDKSDDEYDDGVGHVREDNMVFDIGEDEDEEGHTAKRARRSDQSPSKQPSYGS